MAREAGGLEPVEYHKILPGTGTILIKLWGNTLKRGGTPKPAPEVLPDSLGDRTFPFEQGGRRFELIDAPEGETIDNLIVWLSDDRIAFIGNLVGPV